MIYLHEPKIYLNLLFIFKPTFYNYNYSWLKHTLSKQWVNIFYQMLVEVIKVHMLIYVLILKKC